MLCLCMYVRNDFKNICVYVCSGNASVEKNFVKFGEFCKIMIKLRLQIKAKY